MQRILKKRYYIRKHASLVKSLFARKRFFNLVAGFVSFLLKKDKLINYPSVLMIEPTNRCNFSCSLCVLGSGLDKRAPVDLSFDVYKATIDNLEDRLIWVMLYIQGEPFLHKDIFKMIAYAKAKKIFVSLSTNGYLLDTNNINQVLDSGLDHITVSLDAAREDTFKNYKKIDAFEKIVNNIKALVNQRNKTRRLNPCICLQMIVIKDNEEEIGEFFNLAKEAGVDEVFVKPARIDCLSKRFVDFLPSNKKYIRPVYLEPKGIPKRCLKPWISFVINSAGVASPCCEDVLPAYPVGNIFDDTIDMIWNGQRMKDFRHSLSKKMENNQICKDCSFNVFFRSL